MFTVVLGALLFSVLTCQLFLAIAPGAEPSERSELERRSYQTPAEVWAASFADGEAQGLFEQLMADGIPARDEVLLLNAAIQRSCIAMAATACDFDVFPTYYGSSNNVVRSRGFLAPIAGNAPNAQSADLLALVETLNDAALKHPDLNFSCHFVLEAWQSEMNPSYSLKSGNLLNSEWIQMNIVDKLSPSLNAVVDSIESTEELSTMWFSTDAHWTLRRALKTYDSVAQELGLEPAPKRGFKKVISQWYGSTARVGLNKELSSDMYDIPTDFSNLHYFAIKEDVLSENERSDPGRRAKTLAKGNHKMKQANDFQGYSTYYGPFNGLIVNEGSNNGKTCLLIGDSLTHCLKRYIAANYAKTYSVLPGNFATHLSLEEMIELYEPDDVIFITQAMKYQVIATMSPEFIGLEPSGLREPDEDEGSDY